MKTAFLLIWFASITFARAEHYYPEDDYQDYNEATVYTTPVIYSMPVVYQAPVAYYAPVYYINAASAAYVSEPRTCTAPSIVVHITRDRGTYAYANCGTSGSSVIYIGSTYARRCR